MGVKNILGIGGRVIQIMCIILYMMFLTSGYGYHAEASKGEEKHQFFFTTIKAKEDHLVIKDIKVDKTSGGYMVTGRVNAGNDPLYYTLDNGHDMLVSETVLSIDSLSRIKWSHFKLKFDIPTNKVPKDGRLILNLYEKDEAGNVFSDDQVVIQVFPNNKTS